MKMENTYTNTGSATIDKLLQEIAKLNSLEKEQLYNKLRKAVQEREEIERLVDSYCGIVEEGYWGMDAQEYVNQLRSDDRL